LGASLIPRDLQSSSSDVQLVSLSRWPSVMAINSLRPSAVAPINTSKHGRSSLRRQPK
jgi:hypothetical protein